MIVIFFNSDYVPVASLVNAVYSAAACAAANKPV